MRQRAEFDSVDLEQTVVGLDLTGTEPVVELAPRRVPSAAAPDAVAKRRAEMHAVTEPWQTPPWFRYKGVRLWAKLAFDRVVAAGGIVVAAPLFALLTVLVRLSGPGPVLFRQWRIGRHGVPFQVLKFRTMCADSEERLRADPLLWQRYVDNDFKLALDEDPRVTRIGRFLRRSSLDELPQLMNVLRGEMSMVGPRPVVFDELELYGPWRDAYLAVVPGITGRWQVEGRNDIRFPERAELDATYVNEWSFRYDVKIFLKTVPAVITNRGVK